MTGPFVVVGDKTSHGGTVVEGAPTATTYGKQIARVGDKVTCPKCGSNRIATGDTTMIIFGQAVARHGDKTACGATLISSQSVTLIGDGDGGSAHSAVEVPAGIGAGPIAAAFQRANPTGHDASQSEVAPAAVASVNPLGAPTPEIAAEMTSSNPADRVAAARAAMKYFGIKGARGTRELDLRYDANLPSGTYAQTQQTTGPGYGQVTLGPSAFVSWSHLGSTLGHEIESHWNRQILPFGNYADSHELDNREVQAYKYNLENAQRFGNTPAEVQEFQRMYDAYKADLEHGPNEIYTQ